MQAESSKREQALAMRGDGMTQQAIADALGVHRRSVQRWTCEAFPRLSLAERFRSKVREGGPDECWEWEAHRMPPWGYGQFGVERRVVLAHRQAWVLTHGPIPDGLWVLHSCDNPPCCNPAHLFLGTAADNNADRDAKGRGVLPAPLTGVAWRAAHLAALPRGEAHPNARISDAAIAEMRERYATGQISQAALARDYGTTQTTVSKIVRRVSRG